MTSETLMNTAVRARRLGDEICNFVADRRAIPEDFDDDRVVVLIHGFTASSHDMSMLCQDLANSGFTPLVFNFNSYKGIERAAESLASLLKQLDDRSDHVMEQHGFSIVAHSMGGLVARSFIEFTAEGRYVNAIVTLGTPHSGTLRDSRAIEILFNHIEFLSGKSSGYTPSCESARELTGTDSCIKGHTLLERLSDVSTVFNIPTMSISGGKRWLEVGSSPLINKLANRFLQKNLGPANDGLVSEHSCDIRKSCPHKRVSAVHFRDYPEFNEINHTYLTRNQGISLKVQSWLLSIKSPRTSRSVVDRIITSSQTG